MTKEQALKNIKYGWIAGLISAGITLVLTLLPAFGAAAVLGLDLWNFLDVALALGLTYGIYRKNRTAATLMFIYFVVNRIYFWTQLGSKGGSPIIAILFGVIFFQSLRGTFAYHRFAEAQESPMAAPTNPTA